MGQQEPRDLPEPMDLPEELVRQELMGRRVPLELPVLPEQRGIRARRVQLA